MTLPAGPTISLSDFSTEVGWASNANIDLNWIKNNTKNAASLNSLNQYYSMKWYQRYMDGNCNNGNCTSNCNCATSNGNCNCVTVGPVNQNCNCNCTSFNCTSAGSQNCTACSNVNCANCDSRAWIQNCPGNYNAASAPVYNCATTGTVTYNCTAINCNCNCTVVNCDCNCGA